MTLKTSTQRRTPANSRRPIKGQEAATINAYIERTLKSRLGSMKVKRLAQPKRSNVRSVVPMTRNGMTNIPLQQAYTLRQTALATARHREVGSEVIGKFTLIPDAGSYGSITEVLLNPQELPNTRLATVASNYQKFKFNSAKLCVASNLPTSVTGQITAGFTNQPTQKFTIGASGINEVFSLPGAAMFQLWTPAEIKAMLDKHEPFMIDNSSPDVNTTTQGKFVLTVSQIPSTTAPVTFNMILDYDIDFFENAIIYPAVDAAQIFPSAAFTTRAADGLMGATYAAGETNTIPFPAMVPGQLYQMTPSPEVNLIVGGAITSEVPLNYVSYVGPGSSYYFYANQDDFNNNVAIKNIGCQPDTGAPNQSVPRSTVQPVRGN